MGFLFTIWKANTMFALAKPGQDVLVLRQMVNKKPMAALKLKNGQSSVILIPCLFLRKEIMATTPTLPSYTEVNNCLSRAQAPFQAAQVHGYICGIICATHGKVDNTWQATLLNKKSTSTAKKVLQDLFETSYHLLSEFSFEFSLLLPSDTIDINTRTEALGSWCQGFLAALKQCHVPIQNRETGELTEALNDIIEIAQVNYGDISTSDEEESAYFEIAEYVRLAVLMIFQELRNPDPDSKTDERWMH